MKNLVRLASALFLLFLIYSCSSKEPFSQEDKQLINEVVAQSQVYTTDNEIEEYIRAAAQQQWDLGIRNKSLPFDLTSGTSIEENKNVLKKVDDAYFVKDSDFQYVFGNNTLSPYHSLEFYQNTLVGVKFYFIDNDLPSDSIKTLLRNKYVKELIVDKDVKEKAVYFEYRNKKYNTIQYYIVAGQIEIWIYTLADGDVAIIFNDVEHYLVKGPNNQAEKFHFDNGIEWFMNKYQIYAMESSPLKYDFGSMLDYENYLNEPKTDMVYHFNDSYQLCSAIWEKELYPGTKSCIDEYKKIKNTLISKYGEPFYSEKEWKNNLYEALPEKWCYAISVGHLKYNSRWKLRDKDDTTISLTLKGENNKSSVSISYRCYFNKY